MNISLIRFIIAAVLIMIGILIMVIQTFGVFRLKYARNHDDRSGHDGDIRYFLCFFEAFDRTCCFLVCITGMQPFTGQA